MFGAEWGYGGYTQFHLVVSPGILVTGADTGTARDMAHFEPGGVAF
jgi:hypothetical protein